MNKDEAFAMIKVAVEKVRKCKVEFTPESDLIQDKILDSLDSLLFFMELEDISGLHVPDDINLVKEGYYQLPVLLDIMCRQ